LKKAAQIHANKVIKQLMSPLEKFLHMETSSGILLIITTLIALIWANSPFYLSYEHFVHFPIILKLGDFSLNTSLHYVVNDGLMVIFFFVVGLEIKRELYCGELSSPKKAALPMIAALGGMIVPALFYYYFNQQGIGKSGWGIPMATDIAFAIGVLTLLNKKVPFSLKIFLLALAIVDDLGAVLVIAIFYTNEISAQALAISAASASMIAFLTFSGVRKLPIYSVLSTIVWISILMSGIHATIAGVIVGFLTPLEPFADKKKVLIDIDLLAQKLKPILNSEGDSIDLSNQTKSELFALSEGIKDIKSPLDEWIHLLHPWVSFFIMPIFALVNAGVRIEGVEVSEFFQNPISLGIIVGLLVGKPVGVIGFTYISTKLGWSSLPQGVTWKHIIAVGFLAGIGFTMALFVSNLALTPHSETFSKVGILIASTLAGVIGSLFLITSPDISDTNKNS